MKKILKLLGIVLILGCAFGCTKKEEIKETDASKFKTEYEEVNGKSNDYFTYRTLNISNDNPMVYISASDLVKKFENNETFYVYFGARECPWCRSVIEEFIKVAKENNIDKVYYVDIWSDFHVETLRDTYTASEDGKLTMTVKGTNEYYKLLSYMDNVLSEYKVTYTDKKGKEKTVDTGEKRIYAPNFVYVKNGEAIKLVEGISKTLQEKSDYNGELTETVISEEKEAFDELFKQ